MYVKSVICLIKKKSTTRTLLIYYYHCCNISARDFCIIISPKLYTVYKLTRHFSMFICIN